MSPTEHAQLQQKAYEHWLALAEFHRYKQSLFEDNQKPVRCTGNY